MQIGRKKISMNNKILKQNAIMILYITNVIDELDKKIKHIEQECSYRSKYIDIRVNKELKKYFYCFNTLYLLIFSHFKQRFKL